MDLVRLLLGLAALSVLSVIWSPALAHGLWPYAERFTESEHRKTEAAEVRALILTAYWLVVIVNLALITSIHSIRTLLLANAVAVPLAVVWHFVLRSHNNKKHA